MSQEQVFYGVAHGFERGVFENWADVVKAKDGFPQPVFKKFASRSDAEQFVKERAASNVLIVSSEEDAKTWYAVARGKVVGVFTNWTEVEQHIKGYDQPMYKKLTTFDEAMEYFEKFYHGKGCGKEGEKEQKKESVKKDESVQNIGDEKNNAEKNGNENGTKKKKTIAKKEDVEEEVMTKKIEKGTEASTDSSERPQRGGKVKPTAYYAVAKGNKTGVFTDWADCVDAKSGFKGAKFKKFDTEFEAKLFAEGKSLKQIADAKRSAEVADGAPPSKRARK